MKALIGLGNPGAKYKGTRHNIGFEVLAEIARRCAAAKPKNRFDAEVSEGAFGNERVLLVAPQTFMNCSGRSVRQLLDFYQLGPGELLIICDDINLPVGRLRMRGSGTAGGQKGLADILRHLGANDVPRLRIGVSRPPENRDAADYVLARFSKSERSTIDAAVGRAADAAEVWVQQGVAAAMNRFNAASPADAGDEDAG